MGTKSPYDWVSYVEKAILDLDDIPLLGNTPVFPWEEFQSELAHLFSIPSLKVKVGKSSWLNADAITESYGEEGTCLNFSILPLQGKVSILLSPMDTHSLVTWITEKRGGDQGVINSQFVNGLLAFVAAEVLNNLQPKPFFDGFLLRYLSSNTPPTTRSLGIDISLEAYQERVSCRLILPEGFRKNWIAYFLEKPKRMLPTNLKAVEVSCALQAGHLLRSSKEWKEIQAGDFIPIDNCQVDPVAKSGSLNLTLEGKPLFRVRIKDKGLKILEQPIYEEGPMNIDDETDFGELPEGMDPVSPDGFEASPPPSNPEEAMLDMDEEFTEMEEEGRPKSVPNAVLDKIEQVPLNISVEFTRFKMTCEKLLQLQPGNLLELNIQPEQPLDLVANGKKIAQGELIRVGEVLGVRILNIG